MQAALRILFASAVIASAVAQDATVPDAAALTAQAESLAARGKHRESAEKFAEALRLSPGVESIRFRMAAQKAFDRRFDEALGVYRELSSSTNPAMAGLARNSIRAIEDETARVEALRNAQVAFRAREMELRQEQAAREREFKAREADLKKRQEIFDLFEAGADDAGLERLEEYARTKPVPVDLQFSAVFALQRLGEFAAANSVLDNMPPAAQSSPDGLMARARNERALGHSRTAWDSLSAAATAAAGTPKEKEVREEIAGLPAEENFGKRTWGELQLDALYMTRFSDAIFYGQLREGTFVPGARWIQPFVQLDFTLDTKSGEVDGVSQVYANNLAGAHAGVRVRLIPRQEVWLYGLAGIQKDLRDTTRYEGAWFPDARVGLRGFKGFGPGLAFLSQSSLLKPSGPRWEPRARLAWFAEGGGDAAWYSLYQNVIAYGQLREGFRVLESGGWLGVDVYALQQGTVDTLGLYYNNFVEIGGGLRFTARLRRATSLITRLEYLGGSYLGIDNDNSRGTLPAAYEDLRLTISLWADW